MGEANISTHICVFLTGWNLALPALLAAGITAASIVFRRR
jgi:hypothetical protein